MTARPPPFRKPVPFPEPVAVTGRLLIRAFRPDDAQALYDAVQISRQDLIPWVPWGAQAHKTLHDTRDFLAQTRAGMAQAHPEDYPLGVFEREGGGFLGGSGLHRVDAPHRTAEIGYWVRSDRTRQGICREATAALIGAAFRPPWNLHRIRICCAAANAGSVRVIESLGIRQEALFREERFHEGLGWTDSHEYGVLSDEWDAEAGRVQAAPRQDRDGPS